MANVVRYREYAAECVRQAQGEETPTDKSILLNVALAWLRLAQQVEPLDLEGSPPTAPDELAPDESHPPKFSG